MSMTLLLRCGIEVEDMKRMGISRLNPLSSREITYIALNLGLYSCQGVCTKELYEIVDT